jgi:hypothetical protein
MVAGPLRLFLSYAHEDSNVAAELRKHLAPLRHDMVVSDWYDHDLVAGSNWDKEMQRQLENSALVLVLISSDFLASSYAYGKELVHAIDLHKRGLLRVIPVIVRNSLWQRLPLAELHVLPEGGRPISSWENRDDAFVSVVSGVERAARELLSANDTLINDWLTSRLLRRKVITHVQRRLASRNLYSGPIDGIPGRDTEKALVRFQRHPGLAVDARIGPEVLQRLLDEDGTVPGP